MFKKKIQSQPTYQQSQIFVCHNLCCKIRLVSSTGIVELDMFTSFAGNRPREQVTEKLPAPSGQGLPTTRISQSLRERIKDRPKPLLPGHSPTTGDLDSTSQHCLNKLSCEEPDLVLYYSCITPYTYTRKHLLLCLCQFYVQIVSLTVSIVLNPYMGFTLRLVMYTSFLCTSQY